MSNPFSFEALSKPRLGPKERASLARRLSFLLASGMPLPAALGGVAGSAARAPVSRALGHVRAEVEEGRAFSESAAAYPGLFSLFAVQVIAVGEASGTLPANLSYLAGELEKGAQLRSRLIGSLMYPAVITLAAVSLTVSLIAFVFPKILPVFSGLHAQLPASTRFLIAVSDYFRHSGLLTLLVLAILIAALGAAYERSRALRKECERVCFSLPFIGSMLRTYHVGGSTRTLALLIEGGMPIGDALRAAAEASGSIMHAECLAELAIIAEEGAPLASYLRSRTNLFPQLVADMTAAGEASGALSGAFRSLSVYYENEFDESARRLSSLVEPLLMALMGGAVGFVAIAMISPLYEITQHLHGS